MQLSSAGDAVADPLPPHICSLAVLAQSLPLLLSCWCRRSDSCWGGHCGSNNDDAGGCDNDESVAVTAIIATEINASTEGIRDRNPVVCKFPKHGKQYQRKSQLNESDWRRPDGFLGSHRIETHPIPMTGRGEA